VGLVGSREAAKIIGLSTNKKIHNTTFFRYRSIGLIPKHKAGKVSDRDGLKYSIDEIMESIDLIIEYNNKSASEKIKLGLKRKLEIKGFDLAFNLMK